MKRQPNAAANPALALWLQSTRLAGRVAELGSLGGMAVSMFNRTIQDRCFAVFLSVVLMIPTGGGLWLYYTIDHSGDSKDLLSRLFLHVGMEIVTAAFLCGVLGVVWAVFLPAWIDRVVRFVVHHFVKALAVLLCVILAMFAFTWFTLYH